MSHDNTCYTKAVAKGEHTFTLRSQDKSAVKVIGFWIMENLETCPAKKLHEAIDDAIRMRSWEHRKYAD